MVLEGLGKNEHYVGFDLSTQKWQKGDKKNRLTIDGIVSQVSSRIHQLSLSRMDEVTQHKTVLHNLIQRLEKKRLSHIWHCIPLIGTIFRAIYNKRIDAHIHQLRVILHKLPYTPRTPSPNTANALQQARLYCHSIRAMRDGAHGMKPPRMHGED